MIALAIFFGLVDGCPLPNKPRAWQRWYVEPVRRVQRVALRPVAWIGDRMRIGQRWALYQAPRADQYRLWIEGRDGAGQWRVLFRAGDDEHQDDADLIDYTRPRGTWAPTTFTPPQYSLFAEWIITRMLARHRELMGVRVQLERVHLTPDGVIPSGTFVETRLRNRNRSPLR